MHDLEMALNGVCMGAFWICLLNRRSRDLLGAETFLRIQLQPNYIYNMCG